MKALENIRSTQANIDELKAKITEHEVQLELDEAEFLEAAPENPELVKEILEKYGPAKRLDNPAHLVFITVMSLKPNSEDDRSELSKFFPLEGYEGNPGDCLLLGHIEFTREEQLILKRYGVEWDYSCLGKVRNIKNLKAQHS